MGLSRCRTIFSVVSKTVAEEQYSEYEFRKVLTLYMRILHNCRGLVDTYLPMMNNIMLANLGQNVSVAITLTFISVLQVLGLELFYNPQLELYEQDNRGVVQQVLGQWTKDCENMEIWLP